MYRKINSLAALVLGALFPLGFAPLSYAIVAPLALGALFFLWSNASPRQAAFLGLWFGIGAFGVGVSWVFISLHNYGNMPSFLAAIVVGLFIFILSLYIAGCGYCQTRFLHLSRVARMLLVMPILWVFAEWLRGWVLGGFPWLYLGYSQADTILASLAPISGVFLVSLVSSILGSIAILILVGTVREKAWSLGAAAIVFSLLLVTERLVFVQPQGDLMNVSIIQNNISLSDKWNANETQNIVEKYLNTSAAETGADLVVWPESALPFYFDQLPTFILRQLVEHPADYLFGILERQGGDVQHYYNSAVAVSKEFTFYRKRHLVMFGEYLPLPFLFNWLFSYLDIPKSDFSSWSTRQRPLELADEKVGVTICYEAAFQNQVRSVLPMATVLANISEDSWFGNSLAPWQRLQMARFRALESGRPLIRASNNGLSAMIDHDGDVINLAPLFKRHVLRGELQPTEGITPFVQFGNSLLLPFMALLLLIALTIRRFNKFRSLGS